MERAALPRGGSRGDQAIAPEAATGAPAATPGSAGAHVSLSLSVALVQRMKRQFLSPGPPRGSHFISAGGTDRRGLGVGWPRLLPTLQFFHLSLGACPSPEGTFPNLLLWSLASCFFTLPFTLFSPRFEAIDEEEPYFFLICKQIDEIFRVEGTGQRKPVTKPREMEITDTVQGILLKADKKFVIC